MTIALAILCLALAGLLAYRERVAARDRESAQERLVEADAAAQRAIVHLIGQHNEERANHAAERRELYQRIQAPDVAVMEAVRESRGDRRRARPIAADDDQAFLARDKPEGAEVEGG